jgi:hypothetical protein
MALATNGQKISRDDLQAAYSQLLGEGEAEAKAVVPQVLVVAGAIALGVVTLAYLAGRRAGRRRSAVIVRRV